MGEVYRARDLKLKREVAIKILPEAFSRDPDRMARFQREAEVLASINHPNVAAIHDLEETDGIRYIVLELVEGETIAERIARGPIALEEALDIAKHICEALEAAHEKGIVHRDLKPANVKLTPDGKVKVLDFGLAKALTADSSSVTMSNSPTLLSENTGGVIIGTAAYMSPEQARLKAVDRRADIWSFGCALYEMIAGRRPFEGETVTDILAAVVRGQPDWQALPLETPAPVQELLRRCLAKDPRQRLRDIGDARITIEETVSGVAARNFNPAVAAVSKNAVPSSVDRSSFVRMLPWVIATVLMVATVALSIVYLRLAHAPVAAIISEIQPEGELNVGFAGESSPKLSPDGRRLMYLARGPDTKMLLWVRPLGSAEATPLKGTEDASAPFWSPDGRYVAFFAGRKLMKIEVLGGPPVEVCDVSLGHGGTWAPDGTILFAPSTTSPLYRVPAGGGQSVQLTTLDPSRQETGHSQPQLLPDNRHFLYQVTSASADFNGTYLGSLDGGQPRLILRGNSPAVYAQPGYLLLVQDGALTARRFDSNRLEISGDPVPLAKRSGTASVLTVTASSNGLLAYLTGPTEPTQQLQWFDRKGNAERIIADKRVFYTPRLSPDGKQVAVAIAPDQSTRNIWVFDVDHGSETRLTFDKLHNWTPVWSHDGTKLAFSTNPKGQFHIYQKFADGTGSERPLLEDEATEYVDSWSADGKYIAYSRGDQKDKPGWDIWVLPLFGDGKPFPLLQSAANEEEPSFSPDGKWLAYESDDSGTWEVYIVPFPQADGKWQVSIGGGRQPRWRQDGKELFYLATGNQLMAASIQEKNSSLEIAGRQLLFQTNSGLSDFRNYDVTSDGERFLLITPSERSNKGTITLITNWTELLQRK